MARSGKARRPRLPRRPRARRGAAFTDHTDPRYLEYLASPVWEGKRAAALSEQGGRCAGCGASGALDVHHVSYRRFGGGELSTDLLVVCRSCHDRIHALVRVEGLTLLQASDRVVPGSRARYMRAVSRRRRV